MEMLNVLLPSLPWKHYRNISGCNKNGKSICINAKILPSGKFQSAQFGERLFKVRVHVARNESCLQICVCFQKSVAKGPLFANRLGD